MNDSKDSDEMSSGLDRSCPAAADNPGPPTLDSLLAQLAIASSTRKAPSTVRQHLQAEARLYAGGSSSRRFLRRWHWVWPLAGGAAFLGALIAAVALLLISSTDRSKLTSAMHSAIFSASQWKGLRLVLGGHSAIPMQTSDAEETPATSSDTFAIAYSDPSIANGTGATVRVSLPDSELLAWGVPSLDREPDDLVPVDLTLGDDGLPQAVRLLPATTSIPEEIYP